MLSLFKFMHEKIFNSCKRRLMVFTEIQCLIYNLLLNAEYRRLPRPQVYFYDKNLHHFFNNGSIAGGVSNGSVGLAAFLLDRPTTRLKAKKTWVFFSDSVVSLGSDIVVETNEVIASEPVATTINQVKNMFH